MAGFTPTFFPVPAVKCGVCGKDAEDPLWPLISGSPATWDDVDVVWCPRCKCCDESLFSDCPLRCEVLVVIVVFPDGLGKAGEESDKKGDGTTTFAAFFRSTEEDEDGTAFVGTLFVSISFAAFFFLSTNSCRRLWSLSLLFVLFFFFTFPSV